MKYHIAELAFDYKIKYEIMVFMCYMCYKKNYVLLYMQDIQQQYRYTALVTVCT
jgi:hypothetical protein